MTSEARLKAAAEFDYMEWLAREGRLIPYTKLVEAAAEQLNDLSGRVASLEDAIWNTAITSGLLAFAALCLYLLTGNSVTAVVALLAIYAGRTLPRHIVMRRSAISEIARFEDRLSQGNFGVQWEGQQSTKRMQVRVFWRDGERTAG